MAMTPEAIRDLMKARPSGKALRMEIIVNLYEHNGMLTVNGTPMNYKGTSPRAWNEAHVTLGQLLDAFYASSKLCDNSKVQPAAA